MQNSRRRSHLITQMQRERDQEYMKQLVEAVYQSQQDVRQHKNSATIELNYSGISKEQMLNLNISDLYQRMEENLKTINKQSIQQRCEDLGSPKSQVSSTYVAPRFRECSIAA